MAQPKSGSIGDVLSAIIWLVAIVIAVIAFIQGAIGAVAISLSGAIVLGLVVSAWGPADIHKT